MIFQLSFCSLLLLSVALLRRLDLVMDVLSQLFGVDVDRLLLVVRTGVDLAGGGLYVAFVAREVCSDLQTVTSPPIYRYIIVVITSDTATVAD